MKNKILLYSTVATIAIPTSHAATVTQIAAANFGEGNSWNNASSIWDSGEVAAPGDDYIVNNRLITSGSTSSFAGDSLIFVDGANLQVQTGITSTATITAGGGQIAVSEGGTATVAGSLDITGDLRLGLRQQEGATRNLALDSLVTGGSGFTITSTVGGPGSGDNPFASIGNAANTFGGTWVSSNTGVLAFDNAGAVGINASISLTNSGTTSVAGDWIGNTLTAANGTTVEVGDFSWTVQALTANGNAFDVGTFDVSQLNTLAGADIFGGTGTITVVPEPSVVLLGGFGILGFMRRRR